MIEFNGFLSSCETQALIIAKKEFSAFCWSYMISWETSIIYSMNFSLLFCSKLVHFIWTYLLVLSLDPYWIKKIFCFSWSLAEIRSTIENFRLFCDSGFCSNGSINVSFSWLTSTNSSIDRNWDFSPSSSYLRSLFFLLSFCVILEQTDDFS